MMEALMIQIGQIEQSLDYPDVHSEIDSSSFKPCRKPPGLYKHATGFYKEGAFVFEYLPCHYFGKYFTTFIEPS